MTKFVERNIFCVKTTGQLSFRCLVLVAVSRTQSFTLALWHPVPTVDNYNWESLTRKQMAKLHGTWSALRFDGLEYVTFKSRTVIAFRMMTFGAWTVEPSTRSVPTASDDERPDDMHSGQCHISIGRLDFLGPCSLPEAPGGKWISGPQKVSALSLSLFISVRTKKKGKPGISLWPCCTPRECVLTWAWPVAGV